MEYKKVKSKKDRLLTGFTLIEILISFTIIVVLASIVLVSIGNVKNKTKDAAIKANMVFLSIAGKIFYDEHGYYNDGSGSTDPDKDVCFSDDFQKTKTAVIPIAGKSLDPAYRCNSRPTPVYPTEVGWAACAAFNTPNNCWCVDYRKISKEISCSRCLNIGDGSVYTCD